MTTKLADLRREILDKLNIREEYESFGLKVASESPGKLICHAIDRQDNHPSAVVFLDGEWKGRYVDSGKAATDTTRSMSFWDFAVRYGHGIRDFGNCVRQYAKKTKLWRRLPKKDRYEDRTPEDAFSFTAVLEPTFRMNILGFLKKYPEISAEAVIANCLKDSDRILMAHYPRKSHQPQLCICLPAYGPGLLDAGPTGYVLMRSNGQPVFLYRGDGAPPDPISKCNCGGGMLGINGLLKLEEASHVFKVEGITDMLALETLMINSNAGGDYCVLTNSGGAGEVNLPKRFGPCLAGKHVGIIHDQDVAGQDGVEQWKEPLIGVAASMRNVRLPFGMSKKKGKDLRDWLTE